MEEIECRVRKTISGKYWIVKTSKNETLKIDVQRISAKNEIREIIARRYNSLNLKILWGFNT